MGLMVNSSAPSEIADRVTRRYDKLRHVIPEVEWALHAPLIIKIEALKQQRNAVILAHNYQTPEIFHGVADIVGDSLALAQKAVDVEADVIIMAGVHFMAETAKLLNPAKKVLLPDLRAGCSLAESITAEDIRKLRQKYPDTPVVTYVNTSAAVKAESDICCTSSNAVKIVESLGAKRVIFLPDAYLAAYVASQTEVEIISWQGHCEVHERFTPEEIRRYRAQNPDISVIAHPECPPEVIAEADFAGSTAQMISFVGEQKHKNQTSHPKMVLITECSMSDNVAVAHPEVAFIRPCHLCPHMKRITLDKIYHTLLNLTPEITIAPELAGKARKAVENMLKASL